MDPVFFTCVPTQSARLAFIGEKLILEKSESPLIFVLFLKGKQNKKENPKCDSLLEKNSL